MTRFVGSRVAAFMIRPILSTFLTGFAEDVFKSIWKGFKRGRGACQ
jgi:hypothetical protein